MLPPQAGRELRHDRPHRLGTQYFVDYVEAVADVVGQLHRGRGPRRRAAGLHDARLRHAGRRGRTRCSRRSAGRTIPESALVAARHAGPRQGDGRRARLRRRSQVNLAAGRRRRFGSAGRVRRSRPFVAGRGAQAGHRAGDDVQRAGADHHPRAPTPARTGSRATTTTPAYGQVNMVKATASSINTDFAQLVMDVGPDNLASLAEPAWASTSPLPGRCRRSCSAPARCRRSTWPAATRPSWTTASTSTRSSVTRVTDAERPGALRGAGQARAGARARTSPTRSAGTSSGVIARRHRHRRRVRPAGGRQDRHHRGPPRRLVRRLHVLAHRRGVERAIRSTTRPHGQRAGGKVRVRRHVRRADLGQVHGQGDRGPRELPVRPARRRLRSGRRRHQRHRHDRARRASTTTTGRRGPTTTDAPPSTHDRQAGARRRPSRRRPPPRPPDVPDRAAATVRPAVRTASAGRLSRPLSWG